MKRKVWISVLAGLIAISGAGFISLAQTGAPVPGWIQLPTGEWVPPDHPLAQTVVPPPPTPTVCNNSILQGAYGIHMQGTQDLPAGGTQTVIGVVVRTYDGAGNFTQVDNIKGSVTGIVPDRAGSGTYQVNPDCSASTVFVPGPGISIEEQMVIVDGGREIHAITVSPATTMVTAVHQRIDSR
jgi:hypothetical protein